jgi:alanine racemase
MRRSEVTVDLRALARNVEHVRRTVAPAEVWAVVKADAYGHGAAEVAPAALAAGASALCVATAGEGAALRRSLPRGTRILVLGPLGRDDAQLARSAELEVAVHDPAAAPGLPMHLKVETGMGRFGMSPAEALALPRDGVVGVLSHLATADDPEDETFAREQLRRFEAVAREFDGVTRHVANSAAALRFPEEARWDAVRAGIALYGLSPYGDDPRAHGLEPVLSWRSYVAHVKTLAPGESTGYGRRFVAEEPTRIGLVPVGYADGFRRGLTGTEVLVGGTRRRVVGTVSMDSFAVLLEDEPAGTPVTLIGDGVLAEEHARVLGTISYEIVTGIRATAERASRSA